MNAVLRHSLIKLCKSVDGRCSMNKVAARRVNTLVACYLLVGTSAAVALGRTFHAPTTLPPVVAASSNSQDSTSHELEPAPPLILTPKQRQAILKSNFEKIKKDSDELAALAKSLQEEVGKSNENVLSLKIVEKAEKIENLAKRIKNTVKLG